MPIGSCSFFKNNDQDSTKACRIYNSELRKYSEKGQTKNEPPTSYNKLSLSDIVVTSAMLSGWFILRDAFRLIERMIAHGKQFCPRIMWQPSNSCKKCRSSNSRCLWQRKIVSTHNRKKDHYGTGDTSVQI